MRNGYYTSFRLSILIAVFTLVLVASCDAAWVRALYVLDGDSVIVEDPDNAGGRIEVRLIGIDAPEMGQEPWGRRAKVHLKALFRKFGSSVQLQYDVERRDRYGRVLAYLWTRSGVLLNLRMVADGYAIAYTVPPNVLHADRIADAQKKARQHHAGLWKCDVFETSPQQWRLEHPR
ncbi:MAG TPA: thermonuclease family protein [Dissulfurispiraceae bacterium]|nr:thermonuclease family protein [Dissulfurispiraceae bacterium]